MYPNINFIIHKEYNDAGQIEWVLSHKETGRYIDKDTTPDTAILKSLRTIEHENIYNAINAVHNL
jgi:hypothetical protein